MMQYDNTNRGALFKNDKQGKEQRPDYRGTLNVDGTEYELSAWLKSSKTGTKYMSLSVQPKRERQPEPPKARPIASDPAFDDDIPF